MAQKKKPLSQLSRTARYYRTGSTVKGKSNSSKAKSARRKKASTDRAINSRSEQRNKRKELAKARRKRGIMGKGKTTGDLHHSKNGLRLEPASKNRGRREKSRLKGSKRRKRE